MTDNKTLQKPDFKQIARDLHPDSKVEKAVFNGPHRLNHNSPAYCADQWNIETARIHVEKALKYYHDTYVTPLNSELQYLRSTQQWISVADRLPEKGVYVQVFSPSLYCKQYVAMRTGDLQNGRIYFEGNSYGTLDVTHWMPLPERPKI
jgi:hypothetical protein